MVLETRERREGGGGGWRSWVWGVGLGVGWRLGGWGGGRTVGGGKRVGVGWEGWDGVEGLRGLGVWGVWGWGVGLSMLGSIYDVLVSRGRGAGGGGRIVEVYFWVLGVFRGLFVGGIERVVKERCWGVVVGVIGGILRC